MKLQKMNGQYFEIDANEVNEIKVNIISTFDTGCKVEVIFITDDIQFKKVFQAETFLNGVYKDFFIERMNETLNNNLSYFKEDESLNKKANFPVEAIFEEAIKLARRI